MKNIIIIAVLMVISMLSANCQNIGDISAQSKEKIELKGWSTAYDFNNDKWIIWGDKTQTLERRVIVKMRVSGTENPYTGEYDYMNYKGGSLFLCENSIIFSVDDPNADWGWSSQKYVEFWYDYNSASKQYKSHKSAYFLPVETTYNMFYNNEAELVNWLKNQLKNKAVDYAPVMVQFISFRKPVVTFDLYSYSDTDLKNFNKIIFSLPEDKGTVTTDKLNRYPSPINSNKSIKDYIEWILSYRPVNSIYISETINANLEFVIEADGSVSSLIINGGEYCVSSDQTWQYLSFDSDKKGINNWIASVINSLKFNPGMLNGKPVRTCCRFKISFKHDNEKYKYGDNAFIMFNNGKYGIVDKNFNVLLDFVYDTIIKINNNCLEIVKDGKHGLIFGNNYIKTELYDEITKFDEKCWKVAKNGLYGIINQSGQIIPVVYDKISAKNIDGYTFYETVSGIRHTLYKITWNVLLEFNFTNNESITTFDVSKMIWKKQNVKSKKYGLIDKNDKTIIPCEYDVIQKFSVKYKNYQDDIVYFKKGDKHGVIRYGSLAEPKYWFKEIDLKNNNLLHQGAYVDLNYTFWVKFEGQDKWGLIRIFSNGTYDTLIGPEFDEIIADRIVRKGNKQYQIEIDANGKIKKTKVKKS